jgi:hypothetical protein
MTTKLFCPDCKALLSIDLFRKNASRFGGFSTYCKVHQAAREKASREKHRAENQERVNARRRERYAKEKAAPKQPDMFKPEPTGPRCACGNVLHHYDVQRGKCIQCIRHGITRARETRPSMTAAMTANGD